MNCPAFWSCGRDCSNPFITARFATCQHTNRFFYSSWPTVLPKTNKHANPRVSRTPISNNISTHTTINNNDFSLSSTKISFSTEIGIKCHTTGQSICTFGSPDYLCCAHKNCTCNFIDLFSKDVSGKLFVFEQALFLFFTRTGTYFVLGTTALALLYFSWLNYFLAELLLTSSVVAAAFHFLPRFLFIYLFIWNWGRGRHMFTGN